MNDKKLFLLDAYALIFRAYYAFISNPRKTSSGQNTSAIFGFVLALDEILKKENPAYIAVVFDPPGPGFRHELFPEYKANRDETPEDIRLAVPWIKKILSAYQIPAIQVDRFEADDVIGTIAKQAGLQDFDVFMMTPDKDFAQLVSPKIKMFKPRKSGNDAEIWGPSEVCAHYGIQNPLQVIDILALWGDSSDNVPGIPGVGEKTASKLVAEFGSVENLLENTSNLTGKLRENIEQNKDLVLLSKKLVTIDINAPYTFIPEKLERKQLNASEIKEIFEELEFKTLLTRVLPSESKSESSIQGNLFSGFSGSGSDTPQHKKISDFQKKYRILETLEQIQEMSAEFIKSGEFCFDTETTGLDIPDTQLVGMAFSCREHEAWYLHFPSPPSNRKHIPEPIIEILENPEILKVGQNLKFDIRVMNTLNIYPKGPLFDTMVAHYLLQPEQRHNLNVLSETYLNYSPIPIEDLIGNPGRSQRTMDSVPIDKISTYACEDADVEWQLYKLFQKLLKENDLLDLATRIEMPLIPVLAEMENKGIKLDENILQQLALDLKHEIIESEKRIYLLAGHEFNISSPKQLGEILFLRLKLDDGAKKTKTGQYSTNEETLQKLAGKHPIVSEVLEYRGLLKLLSTYVEALPKMVNPATGRIHTSFNQTIAATGRLSSNNPNLQNIPVREERGREIRKAFIPADDKHVFLSADYSQIELRLMAHLSQDENMIRAFQNGEDIHAATAASIYGIPVREVSREMRNSAKTANFGIIYGISAFGLSQRLNLSRTEAKNLIDDYFRSFPKIREYMDMSIRNARETACVYTIFKRKRYLPDINSRNAVVRGVAERNAINAPIQGSAADIIKIAMINIHRAIQTKGLKSAMLLQVHDELLFDALVSELDELKSLVINEMENAVRLSVPLTVEYGTGKNWLEAH